MAFTNKLTKVLAEATDVAHADGATMITFVMKDLDHNGLSEAMCIGNTNDPGTMIGFVSTLLDKLEENTGMSKKKLVKMMEKGVHSTVIAEKRAKNANDIADADI